MKKKVLSLITATVLFSCFSLAAFAKEVSWSYSNYDHGKYVPRSGSFADRVGWSSTYGDTMTTEVYFELDSTNVSAISAYNQGNGEHPNAEGKKCYLALDVTSVRDGLLDPFDAYAVYTNLPDPKTDLENDDILGDRNEESETVALGNVKASVEYYMRTAWDDYRSSSSDTGQFQAQFNMSNKGISDYNNLITSDVVQGILTYGGTAGEYRSVTDFIASPQLDENSSAATITFTRKVSASELAAYCDEYEIELVQIQARGMDSNGSRVTFASKVTKGINETVSLLQELADYDNIDYQGVISAYIYIPSQNVTDAEADQLTYNLELAVANDARSGSGSESIAFPHSMAWQLEDAGIENQVNN